MQPSLLHWRVLTTALALSLLLTSGCKKKKATPISPQAQAPTITAPAPPTTAAPTGTQSTPTEGSKTSTATKPSPSKSKHAATARKRSSSATTARKQPGTPKPTAANPTTATAQASPPPANTTTSTAKASLPPEVRNNANNNPDSSVGQISMGMSEADEFHARQNTTQLLDLTEQNLRSLTRPLSGDEQNTLTQIRSYMVQSRAALKDQDYERAHTLALKAHLLSDGLVKQ